ncbi:hypothetical protein PRZ48_006092 [Zasmidium cellare]|uniref:TauD/TfdA-like domain-containing protein n=1 Tax=Zasmidium cellare TaxID=395010 RepID=A0ABR0EM57_ZASCE|nr:hypothetical protein PRZ48_006092 [Zasmidium cellare]
MPHAEDSNILVTAISHQAGKTLSVGSPPVFRFPLISDHDQIGAHITGIDLNDVDETSFATLRHAVYTHNVVIVKHQDNLLPSKQFELIKRFDPGATPKHGFGNGEKLKELGNALGKNPFYSIPGSGGVTLVGNGYQGHDHHGLKDVVLNGMSHVDYHADPPSPDEMDRGYARFNTFHFDGIIYGSHPSRVTTFRCVRLPKGPDVTIQWDDGNGQQAMACPPGSTAFISGAQLYDLMSDEEKRIADNSYWEPAPYPFAWYGSRKFRQSGLGLVSGGEVLPLDKLPTWTPDKIYRYPMVWVNPVTGEKSFQIMAEVVRKVYFKSGPREPERIVEDLEEIRLWLNKILDRVAKPEYVFVPRTEEGDMVIWNNWVSIGLPNTFAKLSTHHLLQGVVHSAIEYPESYGPRTVTAAVLKSVCSKRSQDRHPRGSAVQPEILLLFFSKNMVAEAGALKPSVLLKQQSTQSVPILLEAAQHCSILKTQGAQISKRRKACPASVGDDNAQTTKLLNRILDEFDVVFREASVLE